MARSFKILTRTVLFLTGLCVFSHSVAFAQTAKLYHGEYAGNRTFNGDLNGLNMRQLTSGAGSGTIDIEVDKSSGYYYWSSFTTGQVWRAKLDGSSSTPLFSTGNNPYGIALDSSGGRIFVSHWGSGDIRCGNLDGSGSLNFLTNVSGSGLFTDIEFDSVNSYLYFGVGNGGIGIYRVKVGTGCSIIGSPTRIVVDTGRPYGVALDVSSNKVYWTNSTNSRVSRANLDGSSATLNFCTGGSFLTGIDILGNTMYWSAYSSDSSYSSPKGSCSPTTLNTSVLSNPWGIAAVEFNPSVTLEKSTNGSDSDNAPGNSIQEGNSITWEYEVTNSGDTAFLSNNLSDSDIGAVTNLVSGDSDSDLILDVGETWVYQASGTATPGQYSNTGTYQGATAINTVETLTASDSDDSHYYGVAIPSLLSFTSSTADGVYGPGSIINISANYDQTLQSSSTLTVVLDNGVSIVLNNVSGTTVFGSYIVGVTGSAQDSSDLNISSISTENVVNLAGGIQISSSVPSSPNNLANSSNIVIDVTAPLLSEVTAIGYTNDQTPSYVYSSTEVGTATFGGSCSSVTTNFVGGNNSISLDNDGLGGNLSPGSYSNCTIVGVDSVGNISGTLNISTFVIDLTSPSLTSFTSSTSDGVYGPGSTINVTATYSENLGMTSMITVLLNNGVSLDLNTVSNNQVYGTYTVGTTGSGEDIIDLSVSSISLESVRDLAGNIRTNSALPTSPNNLSDSSNLDIDVTAPVVSETIPVNTPTVNTNPSYGFSSTEAGAIGWSGGCDSVTISAFVGVNSLVLDSDGSGGALPLGTYSSCSITVTDSVGNVSNTLNISAFVVILVSPGGVGSPMVWLKADTYSSPTWFDSSGGDRNYTRSGGTPTLSGNVINYNPVVEITNGGFDAPTSAAFSNSNWGMFFVARKLPSDTNGRLFDGHTSNVLFGYHGVAWGGLYINGNPNEPSSGVGGRTTGLTDFQLQNFVKFPSGDLEVRHNGELRASFSSNNSLNGYRIDLNRGAYRTSQGSDSQIAEFVIFNRDLTKQEMQQVDSYLALKYGKTLLAIDNDPSVEEGDYLNGQAQIVWDYSSNSAYHNDVAGIGRDSIGGLDQRISKSINPTSNLTVSTDNDFTSANSTPRTAVVDGGYLIWGHDGNDISSSQITDIDFSIFGGRVAREWKIVNAGIAINLFFKFDNLPSIPSTRQYSLLWDADGDFTNGAVSLASSTSGVFTNVSIPQGDGFLTIALGVDDLELEFDLGSAGDVEASGGNIPYILINGNVSYPLEVTINITSPDAVLGSDYTQGITTIPVGNYDGTLGTAIAVNMSIVDDGNAETSEDLTLTIQAFSNPSIQIADVDSDSTVRDTFVYTITDDDTGPGGVGDHVLFWARADRGTSTTVDNVGVQTWLDQLPPLVSIFQNTASARPTYQNEVLDLINYNPIIRFDGTDDYFQLNDAAFTNLSTSSFKALHLGFRTSSDVTTRQVMYEEGGGSRGFNAYIYNGSIFFSAWNNVNDGVGAPWTYTDCVISGIAANTEYVATMLVRGNDSITGTIECFLNGGQSANPGTSVGVLYPHSGNVGIGAISSTTRFSTSSTQASGANFIGDLQEVIYYDGFDEDVISRSKIESYLAIKQGITLSQGVGGKDYYNARGTIVYHAETSHNLFRNDIAGIIYDGGTDHVQQKSTSVNSDAVITIAGANSLDDEDSLLWGNNNGNLSTWNNTLVAQGYERLDRTWRFDETNDVGTVTVEILSSPIAVLDKDEYVLLVDSDSDFSSGFTVYSLSVDTNVYGQAILKASGVEPGGDSYFTIAQRDITAPILSVNAPVLTPTLDSTPSFSFNSTEAGTITYGGSCSGITTLAIAGVNTIDFASDGSGTPLSDGTYSDCTIIVTDECGNSSLPLAVPAFSVYAVLPSVTLAVANSSISENGGSTSFIATLSNLYALDVEVTFGISGDAETSDYTYSSLVITIPAGALSASIGVTSVDDSIDEVDEAIIVDIDSVVNGIESGMQQKQTLILDDDAQPDVSLSFSPSSIAENGGMAIVTATLSTVSEKTVTVNLTTAGSSATLGTDFSISSSSIVIPPLTVSNIMTVTSIDDTEDDNGELVAVGISSVINANDVTSGSVYTEIIDDDIACNQNPWQAPSGLNATVVMSANGSFTDNGSFVVPSGNDFDTYVMGRNAAAASIRRQQAFDYFLNTYGIDWSTAIQVDASTWVTPSADIMLIYSATDPRYEYKLNAMSDARIAPDNGDVYEANYVMVVIDGSGSTFYGTWGGVMGTPVPQLAVALHGEIFATVPILCEDNSIDMQSFYMMFQSEEPVLANSDDRVVYDDVLVTNDRFSGTGLARSRKGLYLAPNGTDYTAYVTNIVNFYP